MALVYGNDNERKGGKSRIALGGALSRLVGSKETRRDRTPFEDKIIKFDQKMSELGDDFDMGYEARQKWITIVAGYQKEILLAMNAGVLAVACAIYQLVEDPGSNSGIDEVHLRTIMNNDKQIEAFIKIFPESESSGMSKEERLHNFKYDILRYLKFIVLRWAVAPQN